MGWSILRGAHLSGLRRLFDPVGSAVVLVDEPIHAPVEDPRPRLRRIAAEAVILQDEAESVIRGVRAREGLGYLAPRGGPVVRRFFALRDALPGRCAEPTDEEIRHQLDVILHHDAMALSTALELSACEWRSPRLAAQVDALDDLGAPARRLEEIYAQLT